MRENIGFYRGKLKTDSGIYNKGEWVYGNFVNLVDGKRKIAHIYGKGEVVPETVGEYTGLVDKNNNGIFEGDLLESRFSENKEDWKVWKVVFEDGSFAIDSVKKSIKSRRKYKYEQNLLCIDEINFYGLIKIGNIHDNPELLKEGAEVWL